MEDQKRLFLSFILIAGFMYVWFTFFVPPPPPQKIKPVVTASPTAEVQQKALPSSKVDTKKGVTKKEALLEKIENSKLDAVFSSSPGSPVKIQLKEFKTSMDKGAGEVTVLPFMGGGESPLHWTFDVDGELISDDGVDYPMATKNKEQIQFVQKHGDLVIQKTFQWQKDQYLFSQTVELINLKNQIRKVKAATTLSSGTEGSRNRTMMDPGDPLHAISYINEKSVRFDLGQIAKTATIPPGNIQWIGFDSRYFLLTLIPIEGRWNELKLSSVLKDGFSDPGRGENIKALQFVAQYPPRELKAKESQKYIVKLYAGPKDIEVLRSVGETVALDRAIDLGDWLGPIARPILSFLRWLHSQIPNYGIAIILLTILVRLLLFPFTQMQAKSMKKMQEHKPQMDSLKEKHGEDKEAYSRELMNYMKTHRINPMGGCLLLLPQMPIFFSLYRVLYNSIELRQAPFFGWIHDLSAHDPIYVMPVLLGIVMFFQQKLTPSPGADPAQQNMMKIMPVMFSVFMLFLPAGLNLYILVSTLWGIGQQLWVQRNLKPMAAK